MALLAIAASRPAAAADPWLFVNDIHINERSHHIGPITHGGDTNEALLASTIAEMKRVAPDPPVIVMAGDFLAHHIKNATAIPTMVALARRFDKAFPHAQFVMALGNEDSACGDYGIAPNSPFLRAVANAWAPLVNRRGAAPNFLRTFPRDGFYTTKLPIENVRAVVVDNAYWSTFYHNLCGGGNPSADSLNEVAAALRPAGDERFWLIMHIPPGIDAASTARLTHHLAIVPFMRPEPRDRILALVGDPARRVEVVITGHVHRFSYRIVERKDAPPVPLLIAPAVSPILGNLPSFLTADVGGDGVIRSLEEHSFADGRWQDIGGLGTLGVSEFSGQALTNLQHRLDRDAELRDKYIALYDGDAPYHEIEPKYWREYWCSSTGFTSSSFRHCVAERGLSFLTLRGVEVVVAAAGAVVVIVGAVTVVLIARRRRLRRIG